MDEENVIPAPASEPVLSKRNFFSEYRNLIMIAALAITVAVVFAVSFVVSGKQIAIGKPAQSVTVKAGDTLTITWGQKGLTSVGIVLFNGTAPQWIAKGVAAGKGKYDWVVPDNQLSGSDYRLAVFAFPWKKGNPIAYTKSAIQIIGPEYISCSDLSVKNEWPYLPGDYPNLKLAFVTDGQWTGNLGGLDGADGKCQQEADSKKIAGKFIAVLGTDTASARERVKDGSAFALATDSQAVPDGHTCYRLLANGADSLLNKDLLPRDLISVELNGDFARTMNGLWIGRRTANADTKCLAMTMTGESASFASTWTCQNWTKSDGQVYQGSVPPDADLPRCYDSKGNMVFANYFGADIAAFSTDNSLIVAGTPCNRYNRLLCVQQ